MRINDHPPAVQARWPTQLGYLFMLSVMIASVWCFPDDSQQITLNPADIKRFSKPYPPIDHWDQRSSARISSVPFHESDLTLDDPTRFVLGSKKDRLVPLVLGVMSKCPDAQICEDVIDKVLDQVKDKVDLSVVYIGELDQSQKYGVRCRHGNPECRGNIHQLCYRKRFPKLKDWWGFLQCENYAGLARVGEETLARSCAKINQHDWDKDVQPCAEGEEGRKLLQSSVRHTKHLDIVKSCSVLINHRLVCMHDGGWKECPIGHEVPDFVKAIESEYQKLNPNL